MTQIVIPVLKPNANLQSEFYRLELSVADFNGMCITERQEALNFRHRMSECGYTSNWHVAGDPTLIIVRQGQLKLELRNGNARVFSAGEQFIAADYLPNDVSFTEQHGHRALVVGDSPLYAVHIKLASDPRKWLATIADSLAD